MKSDVKATQKTSDGLVFAGRTRLRGIVHSALNSTTAGTLLFCLNGTGGSTYFSVDAPAGDVFAFNIPEDGILFENGIFVTDLVGKVTVVYDK
jgi:hypothetical protein